MEKITDKVKLIDFARTLNLQIVSKGVDEYLEFSTININRPGLQLSGFYEHFPSDRVQIMGETEFAYLLHLSDEERLNRLDRFFSTPTPCTVITTDLEPMAELLVCAEKYSRPLFRTKIPTTDFCNKLLYFLGDLLAPTLTVHGVLMDLYGVGVLITGRSGIGKSETALELVQRGHRLVADDAVIIKRVGGKLIGTAPEIIKYFMEVRGIGVIDVRNMYGVGAVKATKVIDLEVKMEPWDDKGEYDRLGLLQEKTSHLEMEMPLIRLPIKPGRNLAVLLEVACRNHRLKSLGYFAAEELTRRISSGDN
jgi:HPr kinase/phosphorylase